MPTHLVLDIGNSRVKLGLFHGGRLVRHGLMAGDDLAALHAFINAEAIDGIAAASVAAETPELFTALSSIAPALLVNGTTPSPLTMGYATPETLGADRLANAVAAAAMFPQRPALAIGLGTCVIYDLVDADNTYRGGIISPGMRMRTRAMHEFTARLPEVEVPEIPPLVGRSTAESLASGAFHGLRAELVTMIAAFRQQHPDLAVVLTGGDAPRFARALENGIFAHPFLTLAGLHALLLHDRSRAGASAA